MTTPQTFSSLVFTLGGQQWELVRYASGEGRIYHLPDEAIAVEDAHLATAQSIKESLQRWWLDPLRRVIVYGEG